MSSASVFVSVKKRKKLLFFTCLLLLLACTFGRALYPITAQRIPAQDSTERIIAQEVAKWMKLPGYTAVSGAVYRRGKTYQFHYGKLLNGKRADNQTIFEIGSITKTYTGLLLSQAIEDKKVSLDSDVRIYLKEEYPRLELSQTNPITLRHLITHTSGLPLFINCYEKDQTTEEQIHCFATITREDFFEKLKEVSLLDSSGRNYHYSSVGTQLVGYILENVYQLSFQELFKKYIFSRSGEQHTLSEINYEDHLNISIGKNSEGVPMPLINGFYRYSGGLKSSTSSMLNYIKMYLDEDDKVVQQAIIRLAGDAEYGRAYAWNTYKYDTERKMVYHNGGTLGHSSWIAMYPNQKTGIFLVTNIVTDNSQRDLNELSNKIMDQVLN